MYLFFLLMSFLDLCEYTQYFRSLHSIIVASTCSGAQMPWLNLDFIHFYLYDLIGYFSFLICNVELIIYSLEFLRAGSDIIRIIYSSRGGVPSSLFNQPLSWGPSRGSLRGREVAVVTLTRWQDVLEHCPSQGKINSKEGITKVLMITYNKTVTGKCLLRGFATELVCGEGYVPREATGHRARKEPDAGEQPGNRKWSISFLQCLSRTIYWQSLTLHQVVKENHFKDLVTFSLSRKEG